MIVGFSSGVEKKINYHCLKECLVNCHKDFNKRYILRNKKSDEGSIDTIAYVDLDDQYNSLLKIKEQSLKHSLLLYPSS